MNPYLARWLRRFLFVVLLLPVPKMTASEPPPKIRLLLVEGVSNHDWRHRLALVKDLLARDGSFAVDVTSWSAPSPLALFVRTTRFVYA